MTPPPDGSWAEDDPFRVLGVPPDAKAQEIREAYFALVKERTPEKDPEAFKRIRKAYESIRTDSGRWRSHLVIFEAEKGGPPPPLPSPLAVTPEEILEDLLLQEEIALGLRG
jgi:hypothetical protein